MNDEFHGVYLLRSLNELFRGRLYIGYTVNPKRRLGQHNKGRQSGGARRTHSRGPWEMVLIVHGFPSKKRALQFEWAWQHPALSTKLRTIEKKNRKESLFLYHLRVMTSLLDATPWRRLPLIIHVFNKTINFDGFKNAPPHVTLTSGAVLEEPTRFEPPSEDDTNWFCFLCSSQLTDSNFVICYLPQCNFFFHMICLARRFLKDSCHVLPVSGTCPMCSGQLLWGTLVKNSKSLNPP